MHNSKLIDMVSRMNSTDLREFREYVHSPFFNKHKRVTKLIDLLHEKAPDYNGKLFGKESVFKKLFPNEKYNEQRLKDVMSYLVKLLEDYLAYKSYRGDMRKVGRHLVSELNKKEWGKYFQRAVKTHRKINGDDQVRDEHYLWDGFIIESELDDHFIRQGKRKHDESLQNKVNYLDAYYLTIKLKSTCEMLNRRHVISAEYEFRMIDEVRQHIESNYDYYSREYPSVVIYFQIFLMLSERENENHFEMLKDLLQKNRTYFTTTELQAMYQYAQNYCIRRINSGQEKYLHEIFYLYDQLLKTGVIFEGRYISHAVYKNVVSVGIRLKKHDWTGNFIKEYKDHLHPAHRENAYTYNLASWYYSTGQYREAIKLLRDVEFTDVFYHLGAKSMLLKIYYETDEYEALYSLIDAFKVYLGRNKLISDYQYRVHMNLIKNVRTMLNIKSGSYSTRPSLMTSRLKKLKTNLEGSNEVANTAWMLEQLKEIEEVVL